MELLRVANLSVEHFNKNILTDISFIQNQFQKIAIAGETGSGKTTLLKSIAGLSQPISGRVLFESNRVEGPEEKLIPGHPQIAYLSQSFELKNNYWVHEILSYATALENTQTLELYKICRIDHLLNRRTDQLSGGEKQRIALARLLSTSPKLLLLDEPFSNLDPIHKNIIKEVINDISDRLGISMIIVSHDPRDLLSWADEIIIIKNGKIEQAGAPQYLYHYPVNEYCAGLLGDYSLIANHHQSPSPINIDKKLFIRPAYFTLKKNKDSLLLGTIQHILFYGNYYILEVGIDNEILRLMIKESEFKIGDAVYLDFDRHDYWYL